MAIKEGFGKFGLAEKNSQDGNEEGMSEKKYVKETDVSKLKGKKKSIPFVNETRNKELHYGSRTNY